MTMMIKYKSNKIDENVKDPNSLKYGPITPGNLSPQNSFGNKIGYNPQIAATAELSDVTDSIYSDIKNYNVDDETSILLSSMPKQEKVAALNDLYLADNVVDSPWVKTLLNASK